MYRIPLENEQITKALTTPFATVGYTDAEKEQFRENIGAGSGNGGARNYFDNPFFQVNQRGYGTETQTESGYPADRWGVTYGSGGVTWNRNADGSITFRSTTGLSYADLYQRIAPTDAGYLNGKNVTVSYKMSDNSILSVSTVFDSVTSSKTIYNTNNIRIRIINNGNTHAIYIGGMNGKELTVKAAKLEIGNKSTLANDAPPNFIEELRKCQYYFYALPGNTGVQCVATAISAELLDAFIPIEMRPIDPTVTWANLKIYEGNPLTNIVGYKRGFGEQIRFTTSGATQGRTYFIANPDGTVPKLWVSADL